MSTRKRKYNRMLDWMMSIGYIHVKLKRNSAIADKQRDAFVQMQQRG